MVVSTVVITVVVMVKRGSKAFPDLSAIVAGSLYNMESAVSNGE